MHVTVDVVNFCDGLECIFVCAGLECVYAVHQQYLDCLINTWVFAGNNMAVNSVRHIFYSMMYAQTRNGLHPEKTSLRGN